MDSIYWLTTCRCVTKYRHWPLVVVHRVFIRDNMVFMYVDLHGERRSVTHVNLSHNKLQIYDLVKVSNPPKLVYHVDWFANSTVCKACLSKLPQKRCPFDQTTISRDIEELPVNFALLQLVGVAVPDTNENLIAIALAGDFQYYESAQKCIEELAIFLKPLAAEITG